MKRPEPVTARVGVLPTRRGLDVEAAVSRPGGHRLRSPRGNMTSTLSTNPRADGSAAAASAGAGADLPRSSRRLFAAFARYSRWYLARHFHAVRLHGAVPRVADDRALVVYLNHPSWWDPLLALVLAHGLFGQRTHYGPIDAAALERYRFFRRLGFFGVEMGTVTGARRFLRVATRLLARPGTALWITPQGRFTDPRQRPVRLRPGLGRLARRAATAAGGESGAAPVVFLPLAVEYPFWEERFPEALLRFGEPVEASRLAAELGPAASAADWDRALGLRLQTAQETLAAAALARDASVFESLVGGRAGVGGVYDLWRAARALVVGERFVRQHGGEKR